MMVVMGSVLGLLRAGSDHCCSRGSPMDEPKWCSCLQGFLGECTLAWPELLLEQGLVLV